MSDKVKDLTLVGAARLYGINNAHCDGFDDVVDAFIAGAAYQREVDAGIAEDKCGLCAYGSTSIAAASRALIELMGLMDDIRSGDYEPDSFTNQPARTALAEISRILEES